MKTRDGDFWRNWQTLRRSQACATIMAVKVSGSSPDRSPYSGLAWSAAVPLRRRGRSMNVRAFHARGAAMLS